MSKEKTPKNSQEHPLRKMIALLFVPLLIGFVLFFAWAFRQPADISIRATGFATAVNGTVAVTVYSTSSLVFADGNVSFGTGYVNSSFTNCTLDTTSTINASLGCVGFTSETTGLVLENTGNTNLSVSLAFNKTPAQFIGGTNPQVWYKVSAVTGSCLNASGSVINPSPSDWTVVNTTSPGTQICPALRHTDGVDQLRVDLRIRIPSDANSIKSSYFMVTGELV